MCDNMTAALHSNEPHCIASEHQINELNNGSQLANPLDNALLSCAAYI